MQEVLLTFDEIQAMGIKFCRVHLGRLVAAGKFPPAVRLSTNRIAWRSRDIEEWLASRPEVRPGSGTAE